jgi:hypothetical protein
LIWDNAVIDDWDYIGRSTTDFSGVEGMLDGSFMPNDALQDPPTPEFIEFIPSNGEALCQVITVSSTSTRCYVHVLLEIVLISNLLFSLMVVILNNMACLI